MSNIQQKTLAILCGGGPAPGFNSVISAAAIEARNNGWEVIGILDGFSHLAQGIQKTIPLTIDTVSRIHYEGGSILRTSRTNLTRNPKIIEIVVNTLTNLNVTDLITIGGDDTAYTSSRIAEFAKKEIGVDINVVHVPKTIDNDLPLPDGIPTFGFETARSLGTEIVTNLTEDAKTTGRWYFCQLMGRHTGHLALGIGKSAGSTLTIIPEEFDEPRIRLQKIADIIAGSIIKRLSNDRNYGVAVFAEGLIEKIEKTDFDNFEDLPIDEHGHLNYNELNFPHMIKKKVIDVLDKLGINITIIDKEIGYEVRCAPPNAFDIEYTRNLGYAAFDFLKNGGNGAIITIQNNQIVPIPFDEILDPVTGKTQVRMVNINSIQYIIARKYMIRIEKKDFESALILEKMANVTNLTPEEFKDRFYYLVN